MVWLLLPDNLQLEGYEDRRTDGICLEINILRKTKVIKK